MLTKRQNLLETIKGGNPDRFVNQYEYMELVMDPIFVAAGGNYVPGTEWKNGWGVTIQWPEGLPGAFPVHDEEHIVLKDVTQWKNIVKAPNVKFSDAEWAPFIEAANKIERNEQFVATFVAPGMFEKLHYLMGMEGALTSFYEEPEATLELINYLADWEIACAKEVCEHLHPDALFHHDDWGSQISSFLSPSMFEEFFVPAYKKIYGFYKENGIELIVHHSDSYGANLVPYMIEIGIDIWQGVLTTNNLPSLIKKYGEKITFQGGIDNGKVDVEDWTPELIKKYTDPICQECGKLYFIPNTTMGGAESVYTGVYEAVSEEIDKMSKKLF